MKAALSALPIDLPVQARMLIKAINPDMVISLIEKDARASEGLDTFFMRVKNALDTIYG